MRNFKVKRASRPNKKRAMDMGDIAPVLKENFETLTGFKAQLDLLEADPHNPPDMKGLPDDPERPSASDVAKGGSDYKNVLAPKEEKVDHENEKVKQGASEEERIKVANQEFAERFAKATTLYDLKQEAGISVGSSKEEFVAKTANLESIETLDKLIDESTQFVDRIREASTTIKNANVPTGFSGYKKKASASPLNDPLQSIIFGA